MRTDRHPASFRDPHGFLYEADGRLLRQINPSAVDDYRALMDSGLYDALVEQRLLVPHRELDLSSAFDDRAAVVIEPERVPFISYPYEWSPGMLRAAARATLRIQKLALQHGCSLRDASAYNIQFLRGYPTLIDTLSIGRRTGPTPWVAYRQFCQHFLAPLALIHYRDERLASLARVHIDGLPLDLAAELLPARSKLRPSVATHIHAHAASQKRNENRGSGSGKTPQVSDTALEGLVESLDGLVKKLTWQPEQSTWSHYYEGGHNYSDRGLDHKAELVDAHLEHTDPSMVWDLGANTGRFSRLATQRGIDTVAWDVDVAAVERNWADVVAEDSQHLLPLVLDLTNPSPGLGWAATERDSVADRGPVDHAFALALVHHLAIGNNVPLDRVASYFASLATWLTIEFVPKSDSKVQTLLSSREDVFPGYTQDGFETAFAPWFSVERSDAIDGSDRRLYLMRRKH